MIDRIGRRGFIGGLLAILAMPWRALRGESTRTVPVVVIERRWIVESFIIDVLLDGRCMVEESYRWIGTSSRGFDERPRYLDLSGYGHMECGEITCVFGDPDGFSVRSVSTWRLTAPPAREEWIAIRRRHMEPQ